MRNQYFIETSEKITIGYKNCTIVIPDKSISYKHSYLYFNSFSFFNSRIVVEYCNFAYYLSDYFSETGTFLQLPINLAFPIQIGDVLKLGNTELTVKGQSEIVTPSDSVDEIKPTIYNFTAGDSCCSVL